MAVGLRGSWRPASAKAADDLSDRASVVIIAADMAFSKASPRETRFFVASKLFDCRILAPFLNPPGVKPAGCPFDHTILVPRDHRLAPTETIVDARLDGLDVRT